MEKMKVKHLSLILNKMNVRSGFLNGVISLVCGERRMSALHQFFFFCITLMLMLGKMRDEGFFFHLQFQKVLVIMSGRQSLTLQFMVLELCKGWSHCGGQGGTKQDQKQWLGLSHHQKVDSSELVRETCCLLTDVNSCYEDFDFSLSKVEGSLCFPNYIKT